MATSYGTKTIKDGAAADFTARTVNDGSAISLSSVPWPLNYETVAASQSNQVLGASGAAGDYLSHLLIVPTSVSPGAVTISDGSASPDVQISVFAGGTDSLLTLHSFTVLIGCKSATGAWRVTTGSGLSVVAVGIFT